MLYASHVLSRRLIHTYYGVAGGLPGSVVPFPFAFGFDIPDPRNNHPVTAPQAPTKAVCDACDPSQSADQHIAPTAIIAMTDPVASRRVGGQLSCCIFGRVGVRAAGQFADLLRQRTDLRHP